MFEAPLAQGALALATVGAVAWLFGKPVANEPLRVTSPVRAVNASAVTAAPACSCSSNTVDLKPYQDVVTDYATKANAVIVDYESRIINSLPHYISQYVNNLAGWQSALATNRKLAGFG